MGADAGAAGMGDFWRENAGWGGGDGGDQQMLSRDGAKTGAAMSKGAIHIRGRKWYLRISREESARLLIFVCFLDPNNEKRAARRLRGARLSRG